ncbi:MAG: hypothetical protein O7D91_20940 [Planctomycetota bacterium]|nr:hypothetical protein [Planctomycetota bacterium]
MDPAASLPTAALDGAGRVAGDVPCRRCGYNLRGLSPDGRCPECGTAVGRSIHGDLLRYSDPAWVGHLAAGALLMIISMLGGIVVGCFSLPLFEFCRTAVHFVGYWMLTMPDPGRDQQRPIWNIRQVIRLLATAEILAYLVVLILYLIPGFLGALPTALALTGTILFFLFVLGGLVAQLLLFIHLWRLALRIPNDSLARQTRTLMWGIIWSMALIVGGVAITLVFFGSVTGGSAMRMGLFLAAAVVLWLLVFVIWWIVLLFRYRSEFRQAARFAKETWAAAAPPDTT